VTQSEGASTSRVPSDSHRSNVQHQIAAAQRGGEFSTHAIADQASDSDQLIFIEGTQSVVPIGDIGHGMQVTIPIAATSMAPKSSAHPPPHVIPGRQYKFNSINVVAPLNTHSMLPFPNTKNPPLLNPGYQDAHRLYDDMRKHFANRAYSTVANAEVVVIKLWMMTRVPNRKHPIPISVRAYWLL